LVSLYIWRYAGAADRKRSGQIVLICVGVGSVGVFSEQNGKQRIVFLLFGATLADHCGGDQHPVRNGFGVDQRRHQPLAPIQAKQAPVVAGRNAARGAIRSSPAKGVMTKSAPSSRTGPAASRKTSSQNPRAHVWSIAKSTINRPPATTRQPIDQASVSLSGFGVISGLQHERSSRQMESSGWRNEHERHRCQGRAPGHAVPDTSPFLERCLICEANFAPAGLKGQGEGAGVAFLGQDRYGSRPSRLTFGAPFSTLRIATHPTTGGPHARRRQAGQA